MNIGLGMSLINSVICWFFKKRISQILHFMDNPVEVQHDLLLKLIYAAKDTEWGRKFGFQSMKSYQDFAREVPVQDYEDIKPYVDRIIKGEQNIIWPSKIRWFAQSSGTTSDKSKFIPMSHEALEDCHFKAGKW